MDDVWNKYWPLFLAILWPTISCGLNLVLRKKTAEEWVALAEHSPRVAGILKLIRAVGFDPVKGAAAVKMIIGAQAKANEDKLPAPVKAVEKLIEGQEAKTPEEKEKTT